MKPRILVVEDNVVNLELAVCLLEQDGLRVDKARSAREALTRIGEAMPDLILMDIQMPSVDGLTAALHLKADSQTSHVPIVAVTAYAMEGDEQRLLDAGLDGYIAKPIDGTRFASQVRQFLPANLGVEPR